MCYAVIKGRKQKHNKVNGTFPNYGCSSYVLTGGEEIVWCYTCAGLGDDVGAAGMVK